mmetsp:Transcript_19204/g.35110  ORF Transcript_19204/g.35110 Transcript_19204/m.35110 type:complete len:609 (+) Transcript_19204:206-2032(+)
MDYYDDEDSYIANAERVAKQNYLREEIVEAGYESGLFVNYCEELKGTDVDAWTFDELKNCVENFKRVYPSLVASQEAETKPAEPEPHRTRQSLILTADIIRATQEIAKQGGYFAEHQQTIPESDEDEDEHSHSSSHTPSTREVKTPLSREEKINPFESPLSSQEKPNPFEEAESHSEPHHVVEETKGPPTKKPEVVKQRLSIQTQYFEIPCKQLLPTELYRVSDASIEVGQPEEVKQGLLKKNYFVYPIKTQPFGWTVKRRFSDFAWLRDFLVAYFPGHAVPPVPSKFTVGNAKAEIKFLSRFLNALLKSQTLKCCNIVEDFLSLPEPNAVNNMKKQVERMKAPEFCFEMSSTEGVLLCDAEEDLPHTKKLTDFIVQSEILKTRLRTQSSQLTQALQAVSNILVDMKDSFKQLDNIQQNFSENKVAREMYFNMSLAFSNWKIHEQQKALHVDDVLTNFFSYQASELQPIKDLLREREESLITYLKTFATLTAKKDRLWSNGDINKWELTPADRALSPAALKADKQQAYNKMLPNETAYVARLKDRYSYFNYQAREEAARVMKIAVESERSVLRDFGKKESEIFTNQHVAWTQLMQKLTDIRQSQEVLE